jgi:hypothetical protein
MPVGRYCWASCSTSIYAKKRVVIVIRVKLRKDSVAVTKGSVATMIKVGKDRMSSMGS